MNPILSVENVTCRKGDKFDQVTILSNVSFTVNSGEIVSLLGSSGSGKSTLLRTLVGLDPLSSGQIFFHEKSVQEWDIQELRRRMGYVLQLPYLFPGTVAENILYAPRFHHRLDKDEAAFVQEMLSHVGLPSDLAQRRSHELSVGQQMRVSLARTLANQPDVLLLDEPTASLDPKSAQHILQLILRLNREDGITVIVVTHDRDISRQLNGRWLCFMNKQINECDSINQLSTFELQEDKDV